MTRRLRDETGSTLIAAVLIVIAMLGLGLAVLAASDTQSKVSGQERTRESGFNLAEAALNGQVLQLTRTWAATNAMPTSCDPTVNNTRCPEANALGGGYTAGDYGTACTGTSTPSWQTMVRDNASGEQYWTQSIQTTRASYDANNDGIVWVRANATSKCQTISVVSQVSQIQVPVNFPSNVATANWFQTSNQGKKVIVDTLGSGSQPAPIVMRCAGLTQAQCLNYPANKGQVQPPAVRADGSGSSTTLSSSQIASLEAQAQAAGTYWASGTCPSSASQLASVNGSPVVVKGPCNPPTFTGNYAINSAASPGALIWENGSLSIGGTLTFYGLIYMVNQQGSNASLLNIQGNAQIVGVVSVDGAGGITAGSSKTNLINDPRAAKLLRGSSGAKLNKNTFRIVPTS